MEGLGGGPLFGGVVMTVEVVHRGDTFAEAAPGAVFDELACTSTALCARSGLSRDDEGASTVRSRVPLLRAWI